MYVIRKYEFAKKNFVSEKETEINHTGESNNRQYTLVTMSLRLTKEVARNLQQFKQMYMLNNEYQRKINCAHEKLISNHNNGNYIDETEDAAQYEELKKMYEEALSNSEKEQK
jgi:hypothetical protein